ncbi:hypothetical protein [Streptomyces fulvoviolaceus]|uniref:hypothetical protein n=1 Tax=Streptomyces fulvoviolaceus TaxID=285535 RepID=UPI000A4912A7|nr:hypothetical protein [Streptomyces fulvoviolaceus]
MMPVDPARAFEAWESMPGARLTEDTPGQKWTVHVHSNRFYILTAEDPAAPADGTPAAEVPAAPTAAPSSAPDCPHARQASAPDHRASRTLARRRRASGMPGRDQLPGHLPAMAVELVGKAVRVKLAQGYSHKQIRDEFEEQRAQAVTAGDTGRATALGTMLTVHALMVAGEDTEPTPSGPGHSSSDERQPVQPHAASSRREGIVSDDNVLSRIDSVLHDAAVAEDLTVSDDAMRSVPLADEDEIIHAYTRAQALADGSWSPQTPTQRRRRASASRSP